MSTVKLATYLRDFFDKVADDETLLIEATELLRNFIRKFEPKTALSKSIYLVEELESSGDEPDDTIIPATRRMPRRKTAEPGIETDKDTGKTPSPRKRRRAPLRAVESSNHPPASPTKIRTAVRNCIPQLSDPAQVYPALKGNGYIAWHSLAEELTSLKDCNSQYCTLERAEQSIEMFKEIFSVEGGRRLSEGQNSAALNPPAAPVTGALPERATTTIINPQGLYHECCQAFRAVQHYTANVVKNDYVRKVYAAEFYCRYAMLLESAELELLRERLGLARKRGVGKESLVTRALIQDQWGVGALEQPYYVNKIHNLKESGKRWAMVKQSFGKVALLMIPPHYDESALRRTPLSHLTFIIKWIKENLDGAADFVKDAQRQLESDASSNLPEKLTRLQMEASEATEEE